MEGFPCSRIIVVASTAYSASHPKKAARKSGQQDSRRCVANAAIDRALARRASRKAASLRPPPRSRGMADAPSSTAPTVPSTDLATVERTEDGPASTDDLVNRAFDGVGSYPRFHKDVFDRNSLDGRGMRLNGYVHYRPGYNNAFWDGGQMVFGDGDGMLFTDFTRVPRCHRPRAGARRHRVHGRTGVSQGAGRAERVDVRRLRLAGQAMGPQGDSRPGRLADRRGNFHAEIEADALRSMKAPGTAYNNPQFGRDPQPDHMTSL